jgi:zinc transporter ZupT
MSYQLFPSFVASARVALGLPALTIAELSVSRSRPFTLLGFNAGVIAIAVAFMLRAPALGAADG